MSKTQALEKMEPAGVVAAPVSFEATFAERLLEKAIDSKQAIEVIEKLRQMRREDRLAEAERSFDRAMSEFQKACPQIMKSRAVSTNAGDLAYKYAPLEKIEEVIRPIEQQFNFTHTFDQDTKSEPGYVITICEVTHCDPDPRIGSFSKPKRSMFPLGTKTAIMSNTQQYAAALSFANRRTLVNAYGLIIVGEDKDGAGADTTKPRVNAAQPVGKAPPAVAAEHRKLCEELWMLLGPDRRGKAQNWDAANQWLWKNEVLDAGNVDEKMPDLKVPRLKAVIEKVKEKLK